MFFGAVDSDRFRDLGANLITVSLVLVLALSLPADPVVRNVGPIEIALGAGVLLLLVACIRPLLVPNGLSLSNVSFLQIVMIAFAASFALSGLIGLKGGQPLLGVARSTLPYALAFVVLPLIFTRSFAVNMNVVLGAVLFVGLAQAFYQIYLFLAQQNTSVVQTLVGRITLADARVTLPLAAAANCVALAMLGRGRAATAIGVSATMVFGLAALVTLTRTLVIVYFISAIATVALWLLFAMGRRCWAGLAKRGAYLAAACIVLVLMTTVPQFGTLTAAFQVRQAIETGTSANEQADMERISGLLADVVGEQRAAQTLRGASTTHEAMSAILREEGIETLENVAQGYADAGGNGTSAEILAGIMSQFSASVPGSDEIGGGRISDEWLPALRAYGDGNVANWLFGIGAGTPFVTGSGDPRTYIHNLPIYLLLYNGALGLALYLLLQLGLAWTFLRRVQADNDFVAFACLSMLAVLNGFALLFAVHKLVAFNLLVAVILIAYLRQEKSV